MKLRTTAIGVITVLGAGVAIADNVADTEIVDFTAGTPAVATEVNANFEALRLGINDNDARVTTNEAAITANDAAITANDAAIATNEAGIAANGVAITGNGISIADNAAAIATAEAAIAAAEAAIATAETSIATLESATLPASTLDADCGADPAALQAAVDSIVGSAVTTINATGTCNRLFLVNKRNIQINGPATIERNLGTAGVFAINAHLILNDITVDSLGGSTGVFASTSATVQLINSTVTGANGSGSYNILVANQSNLLLTGSNTIGAGSVAGGIVLVNQSNGAVTSNGTLSLQSTGVGNAALEVLQGSNFSATSPGSTLNVPANSTDIIVENGSSMAVHNGSVLLRDLRVVDNSSFSASLDEATDSLTLGGLLVANRGSTVNLTIQDSAAGATIAHTGEIELSLNSSMEVFGTGAAPASIVVGTGNAFIADINSAFLGNNLTFDATSIGVYGGFFVIGDDSPPVFNTAAASIELAYNANLVLADGLLGAATVACGTGSTAFELGGADLCTP